MPGAVKSLDTHAAAALEAMRIPPHSVEAEQAVLGGLMLDNATWEQVADRLREEDFYRQDHRLIFRAITELTDSSTPFDVVTLAEWLQSRNQLEQAGGLRISPRSPAIRLPPPMCARMPISCASAPCFGN